MSRLSSDPPEYNAAAQTGKAPRVLSLFGTRPEVIKFAPVIREMENRGFETVNVTSAQHRDLIDPLIRFFDIRIDHDLNVMREAQTLNGIAARVLEALEPILIDQQPDIILVQGDTTTAMCGALAGWNQRIPVGHIEAGLRTDTVHSPFPEEMNRRLISQMAALHFPATERNRSVLLEEKTAAESVFVTGNTVIDALEWTLENSQVSPLVEGILAKSEGRRLIVLTTHRRESFGEAMSGNLETIGKFVAEHEDVELVFPVHPNPAVRAVSEEKLAGHERVQLIDPLDYSDFQQLLSHSWLLVSDSGGLQEEAPTLGKPLLILRENTERPEAVECGAAKLIGGSIERLERELHHVHGDDTWAAQVREMENPFGDGRASERIAEAIANVRAHA